MGNVTYPKFKQKGVFMFTIATENKGKIHVISEDQKVVHTMEYPSNSNLKDILEVVNFLKGQIENKLAEESKAAEAKEEIKKVETPKEVITPEIVK